MVILNGRVWRKNKDIRPKSNQQMAKENQELTLELRETFEEVGVGSSDTYYREVDEVAGEPPSSVMVVLWEVSVILIMDTW